MIAEKIKEQVDKVLTIINYAKRSAEYYSFPFFMIFTFSLKPKEGASLRVKDFNLDKNEVFIRGKWIKIENGEVNNIIKTFVAGKPPDELIFHLEYRRLKEKFRFYAKLFNAPEITLDDVRWIRMREMFFVREYDIYKIAERLNLKNIAYLEKKIGGENVSGHDQN